MFLDKAQLKRLTGFAQKRRQVEALRVMGIPFHINGRNEPVVASSTVEGRMPAVTKTRWKPAALTRVRDGA